MQTDDTLSFITAKFLARKKEKLKQAKLRVKQKKTLFPNYLIEFNSKKISLYGQSITIIQKG
jgi:hypothetical protein